jgi:serpin B
MNPTVPTEDAAELAKDNQAFAGDLYQSLRAQGSADDNLVFSPGSISVALAMLWNGARTETATEIATALHFTLPVDRWSAAGNRRDKARFPGLNRHFRTPDGRRSVNVSVRRVA